MEALNQNYAAQLGISKKLEDHFFNEYHKHPPKEEKEKEKKKKRKPSSALRNEIGFVKRTL